MKSVLISIQPKWVELIVNGKKTIEVRKTKPKLQTPFKCYIYCTQSDLLTKSHYTGQIYVALSKKYREALEKRDNQTLSGKIIGEFICDRILTVDCDSVAPFDPERHEYIDKECCLDRDALWEYTNGYCCYGWHISQLVIYDEPKSMKRPPQSWCYVDEMEEKT